MNELARRCTFFNILWCPDASVFEPLGYNTTQHNTTQTGRVLILPSVIPSEGYWPYSVRSKQTRVFVVSSLSTSEHTNNILVRDVWPDGTVAIFRRELLPPSSEQHKNGNSKFLQKSPCLVDCMLLQRRSEYVRVEVFTGVTMKNVVF
jgi:hypothetical protein